MALEKVGVRATIEGLSSFENGMRRMDRSVDQYGKAAMSASERTKILTDTLKKVGIGLTAVAAVSGALIFSSVKLAARVQTLGVVTTVLGKNVGKTEKQIRDLEQAIVDQGITLRTARQAIALMIQSNVDLARATDLARLAQDAAVIAGINSSEAFERLVFVITSGNVRMARTLGLQVSFAQGMERMAEATGKTAAELTPLERITARTNEVIRAGANIAGAYTAAMETAGKQVTSLDRFIEESKRTLGEAWLPVYAGVIKFVTDSLKSWLNLSQAQRDVASTTLGMITVLTGLLGVAALIGAKLPGLIAGFGTLAKALGITGDFIIGASASLGILLVAVVAVSAAFIKLVQTYNKIQRGVKLVNDAFEEHREEVLRTAGTYEEYRAELVRSGLIVAKLRLGQERFNKTMKLGGEEAVLTSAGIEILTKSQFDGSREIQRTTEAMARQKAGMGGLVDEAEEAAKAAEKLRKQQEFLNKEMDRLSKTIDLDITKQFEDYQNRVVELTATITELEKKDYLTKEQQEQLETMRGELIKLERQWDETTAKIIFDLAQQRLAIDGFTEEELSALRKLAGPEGLGLIDEAAVVLLEKIDEMAGGLDRAGDQSDIFANRVEALQAPLINATNRARDLAYQISRIQSKSVSITVKYYASGIVTVGGVPLPSTLPSVFRQTGGFVQAGQAAVIGERGTEIFTPRRSGMVLNNRFVGAINSLVAAIKSAPALMSAPMTPSIATSTINNEFNMNINTRAPIEPIISDFRTMQSMANAL